LIAGFAPDEDFAVVGGGGENVAVLGVCPGNGPYCSFVAGGLLAGLRGQKYGLAKGV